MTPLHLAVENNRTKMVECLLDQGADFNLQDENKVILHTNAVQYFELYVKVSQFRTIMSISLQILP